MRKSDLVRFAQKLRSDSVDAGDNVLIQCPFAPWTHKSGRDRTPSMSVRVNDHGASPYHCFGCEQQGKSLDMLVFRLMDFGFDKELAAGLHELIADAEEGLEPLDLSWDAVRTPPPLVRLRLPPPPEVRVVPEVEFVRRFGQGVYVPYLRRRGLREETVKAFQIGFDVDAQRVVTPVRWHTGEIIGAVGRAIWPEDPKPHFNYWKFPKSLVLFGEHLLREEPVVVCEGPFDVMKVWQAGFNAVAVLGAKFKQTQVDKLVEWGQPVTVFFDPDDTGRTQGERLEAALRRAGLPVARLEPPEGYDAGKMSSEALRKILGPSILGPADVQPPTYWGKE